jgi:Zn-dependent M28 family amino/carboxypeptidase
MNFITKPHHLYAIIFILSTLGCTSSPKTPESLNFDGNRAFQDLEHQVDLGPRVLGSEAHEQVREWIIDTNEDLGWTVDTQNLTYQGQEIYNIIAKRETQSSFPWVIVGAHYDSREYADRDPVLENQTQPVPGANDGASGVSVLLELARILPSNIMANIWLVFFDAEDNGDLPGGEWILGSRAFVESLDKKPDVVVIIDMIGDSDLNIYTEIYSDQNLTQEIWGMAANLGYENHFIPEPKYQIIDDHLPFVQAGIPAVDIIDFDYPFWHTVEDTVDKVSPESLQIVGDVLLNWLVDRYGLTP